MKKASIEPYSAVGIVAAQSLGEPGTQMTMRTFHYAGVAEHVPTGLPRLIELVDAKKEPKKSLMDIRLPKDKAKSKEEAEKLAIKLEAVPLPEVADIVENFSEKKVYVYPRAKDMSILSVSDQQIKTALKKAAGVTYKLEETKEGYVFSLSSRKKDTDTPLKYLRKLYTKLKDVFVKGISGVTKTVVVKEGDEYLVRCSGRNLTGVLQVPEVDPSRIYTNSVMDIYKVFGIEAARNALAMEIKNVMELQGLAVDIRHIYLLADALTADGLVKSIGRHGLSGEKAGVLGRAAFEETVTHLVNATEKGEYDMLTGVTENMIIGQTIPIGTGKIILKMKPPKKIKK